MTLRHFEIPEVERELLHQLWTLDQQTAGRPHLSEEQARLARSWLSRLMVDGEASWRHIDWLQECYHGKFEPPALPRWLCREGPPPRRRTDPNAGFRHYQLLPEDRALAVAEQGPEALTNDELAILLLNPFALWDLADLILTLMPRYWSDVFGKVGKEEMERLGRELPLPGIDYIPPEQELQPRRRLRQHRELALSLKGQASLKSAGGGAYTLSFGDDAAKTLQHKIAEHLYGDANRSFTLTLYRLPVADQPEQVRAELEVTPAPTRSDLTLTITFPTGDRRAFTLEVPPQPTDPEDEPRATTRSLPCESLPAVAFAFKGGEWCEEAWPPELRLHT